MKRNKKNVDPEEIKAVVEGKSYLNFPDKETVAYCLGNEIVEGARICREIIQRI